MITLGLALAELGIGAGPRLLGAGHTSAASGSGQPPGR